MQTIITSTQNTLIKDVTKYKQKKYRQEFNRFLVEGFHLVEEAYRAGLLIQFFYLEQCPYDDVESYQVTDKVLEKISSLPSPQGIIGVCEVPTKKDLSESILVLDNVQDPGNIGTLLRSASAFGVNTVIAENSVDFFNEKVIRSSQGAVFKLNLINTSIIDFVSKNSDYEFYATDLKSHNYLENVKIKSNKIGIVLGNEGSGVNEELLKLIDNKFKIKMLNMESLNVGVAGSIIMYEIKKGVK